MHIITAFFLMPLSNSSLGDVEEHMFVDSVSTSIQEIICPLTQTFYSTTAVLRPHTAT
jgi:hypothetical protein